MRRMRPDGAVDVPAFSLPFSSYASQPARADMADKFERLGRFNVALTEAMAAAGGRHPILTLREVSDRILFQPFLEAQRRRYAVAMTEERLGGVEVQVFSPEEGLDARNKDRVLVNLHGGGFMIGWPILSQVESIPISAAGRIKVISVNYRQFPEAMFPAATEDVAAVYQALLERHAPEEICVYGGSAGGMLAGQTMAWLRSHDLPPPAAIALLSASLDPVFLGDSAYVTPGFGSYIAAPTSEAIAMPYFSQADASDPHVSPMTSEETLAHFPPTLLVTSSRAAEMSAATASHLALLKAGADARLAVWDGLDHTFMYNPALPESQDCYDMVVKFFEDAMLDASTR